MSDRNLDDKLSAAYDRMMARIHQFINDSEHQTMPSLQQRIQLAKERAIELKELSGEEAEQIALWLERDMHDAVGYLQDSGEDFATWLQFDLQQVESRFLALFASVADKTRLELNQLAQQAIRAETYHTGEVTSIGTLYCVSCGGKMQFRQTARIPPCPRCHQTRFTRQPQPAS
ncbi:protein of unknown function DUF1451 [Methylophaga frappieri]|uniref:Zinc ribbon-containing protein n=1 Tax=Methylophaga frappieri (strain ATCC BAA-2434 / DSM 25690 / JAM7) TaxID=754477 RepID=I1YFV9_METFJ|nr:zinc ribbon-containing protein [Methylophaga frappieri]AFJ01802.1 protein of unknown function DUF1451 [Methylophaga frappieri]